MEVEEEVEMQMQMDTAMHEATNTDAHRYQAHVETEDEGESNEERNGLKFASVGADKFNDNNAKTSSTNKKKKKKKKLSHTHERRFTIRKPDWHYLRLKMIFNPPYNPTTISPSFPPDLLTWRTHLSSALSQFLGISGTAISIDFLHTELDQVWIRIPREDAVRFTAAIGGWRQEVEGRDVGFRPIGASDFMMAVSCGNGRDLFG